MDIVAPLNKGEEHRNIKRTDSDCSIVFIYLGNIPNWHIVSLNQARLFNNDVDIYLICDESGLTEQVMKSLLNVNIVTIQSLGYSEEHKKFREIPSSMFRNQLFVYATERLFCLETFMKKYNLLNVIHIESDVLVYTDLYKLVDIFESFYSMAATPVSAHIVTLALFYIKDPIYLSDLNRFLLDKLAMPRHQLEKEIVSHFDVNDWQILNLKKNNTVISEMTLINLYHLYHGEQRLGFLPILPKGTHSYNIEKFNSIFDGASWGQYVGGTGSHKPGIAWEPHYVGNELLDKKHELIWKKDEFGRKIPYCRTGETYTKINNLHIHCKNLELYAA
jgi:hypothetical protein